MGRKNKNAHVSRRKGRFDKPDEVKVRRRPDRYVPPTPLGQVILPDGTCRRNPNRPKARFATEAKAKAALAQAQRNRARQGSTYVEKRYFACPDDEFGCGGWHLTSREAYHD